MEAEQVLTVVALLFGASYGFQIFILRKLNYTCGVIGKIKTFLKLVHPKEAKALD